MDLGLRFPGTKYAGLNSIQAHDAFVKSGDLTVALFLIGIIEVTKPAGPWHPHFLCHSLPPRHCSVSS